MLVVGASASGVQIADELRRSGRKVTLAVGRHTRVPRTWRGRDIFWWMDRTGILAERTRDLPDPERPCASRRCSLPDGLTARMSICATLQALGRAARRARRRGRRRQDQLLRRSARRASRAAQAKLRAAARPDRCLRGLRPRKPRAMPIVPVDLSREAPRRLSTAAENIRTIVWATGYRRDFPG